MPYINDITVQGHAGQDGEARTLQSGKQLYKFSLAVSEGRDENKKTTWFNVSLFGKAAEWAIKDGVKKGELIKVNGKVDIREHEGKSYFTVIGFNYTNYSKWADKRTILKTAKSELHLEPETPDDDLPF